MLLGPDTDLRAAALQDRDVERVDADLLEDNGSVSGGAGGLEGKG